MSASDAERDALLRLRDDPGMAALIERHGAHRVVPAPFACTFQPLARSVVYQQLSGKAASTIYGRLAQAFGDGESPAARKVAPASIAALREVGLSLRKAEYLKGLAEARERGELPTPEALDALDDDGVIEALTVFRGIGRWTVEMLLIAWLGRPDVLPVDDLGVRKGVRYLDGLAELPDAAALTARAEVWRPYRSTACWYLWRAADEGDAR